MVYVHSLFFLTYRFYSAGGLVFLSTELSDNEKSISLITRSFLHLKEKDNRQIKYVSKMEDEELINTTYSLHNQINGCMT